MNKLLLLVLLAFGPAMYVYNMLLTTGNVSMVQGLMYGGLFGGLIFALVTIFKPAWAHITAPIYALLEGLLLGAVSAFFEAQYPGIAFQAMGLTFGVVLMMAVIYRTGLIKVTQKFRAGVIMAGGAILLLYLVSWVMSFFGASMSILHSSSPMSIGLSFVIVGVASLFLLLDFDNMYKGVQMGAPKQREWYFAFGFMLTIVWLYLEILRLLSKLRD